MLLLDAGLSSSINLLQTISEILSTAERVKLSPLEVAEQIFDGKMPDIKPSVKRKLTTFLRPIRELRKLANEVSVNLRSFVGRC